MKTTVLIIKIFKKIYAIELSTLTFLRVKTLSKRLFIYSTPRLFYGNKPANHQYHHPPINRCNLLSSSSSCSSYYSLFTFHMWKASAQVVHRTPPSSSSRLNASIPSRCPLSPSAQGSTDCKYGEVSVPEETNRVFLDPGCEVYRSIFLS